MVKKIAILTEDRYEKPLKKNSYIDNILREDFLLLKALESVGFAVSRVSWSSKTVNWECFDYAIFRTTWDYFERLDEFLNWLHDCSKKLKFLNSLDLIKWNLDKNYLKDFNSIGIVPSLFLKKQTNITLDDIFKEKGWEKIVIKPTISAAAWNTHLITKKNINKMEVVFNRLNANFEMIIQQFQESVLSFGEISMVVFGGKFSHAVLKKGKKNDFRVQDDFGGSVYLYNASKKEIAFAEKVVSSCFCKPIYARVDVLYDNEKNLVLSELELIEPELWFRLCNKSEYKLSREVQRLVFGA